MQNNLSISIRWGLTLLIVIVRLPSPSLCRVSGKKRTYPLPAHMGRERGVPVWRVVPDVLVLPRSGPGAPARWQAAGDVSWSRLLPCRCVDVSASRASRSSRFVPDCRPKLGNSLRPDLELFVSTRSDTLLCVSTPPCSRPHAVSLSLPRNLALSATPSGAAVKKRSRRPNKEALSTPKQGSALDAADAHDDA